jgi:hypothetical protein
MLLAAPAAHAADADPEKLFAEGSALIEQGRCSEALPKLQEAQRLDPGIGTQFNIAVCEEQLGRLGSAWRDFAQVVQLARASGKKQREEAARAKLEALRARVPTLVIRSAESGDVTVKVDGDAIKTEAWSFVPVDPGDHTVEANAPTKKSWTTTVHAPAVGTKLEVLVPVLDVVQRREVVTVETSNKRRTLGFILGGVGVAGVAAAAVTGVMLLQAKLTADERCTPRCITADGKFDQEGADAVSRGNTLLPINAVAWGVAILGLGAGAFFILTSPSAKASASTTTPRVDATLAPRGGTLRLTF